MAAGLVHENIWMDKCQYDDAERQHYENLAKLPKVSKECLKELKSLDRCPMNVSSVESLCPKSFVALKKVSSGGECLKENVSVKLTASDVPTPSVGKRNKSQKCTAVKDDNEWVTVWSKSDSNEKSNKNKKNKEASRLHDLTNNYVSKKDVSPPADEEPDEPTVQVEAPVKTQKNKENKSKAEKKRAHKKEKVDVNKSVDSNVEINTIIPEGCTAQINSQCSLASEVAKARQHIKNSLECMDTVLANVPSAELVNKISSMESTMQDLKNLVLSLKSEVDVLKKQVASQQQTPQIAVCPARPQVCPAPAKAAPAKAAPAPAKVADDSDDGVDLFASDSEGEDDAAAAKIKEERLAAYNAKKSKKPALIAKSSIILDVKPWDDETDMKEMERLVRSIVMDGLLWGASKLVPLAYGIKKLQINCVVEDEKVSVDLLQEEIEKFDEVVQSVDIAAFNKI